MDDQLHDEEFAQKTFDRVTFSVKNHKTTTSTHLSAFPLWCSEQGSHDGGTGSEVKTHTWRAYSAVWWTANRRRGKSRNENNNKQTELKGGFTSKSCFQSQMCVPALLYQLINFLRKNSRTRKRKSEEKCMKWLQLSARGIFKISQPKKYRVKGTHNVSQLP